MTTETSKFPKNEVTEKLILRITKASTFGFGVVFFLLFFCLFVWGFFWFGVCFFSLKVLFTTLGFACFHVYFNSLWRGSTSTSSEDIMHFQLLLMIKIQFLETFIPLAILPQKAVLVEHFQGSSNMPELRCICTI